MLPPKYSVALRVRLPWYHSHGKGRCAKEVLPTGADKRRADHDAPRIMIRMRTLAHGTRTQQAISGLLVKRSVSASPCFVCTAWGRTCPLAPPSGWWIMMRALGIE